MRIFYLFLFLFSCISCTNQFQKKKVQLDKELAITPILSEKFDSLLLDVRNLPTRQRVSCLLQISYKNEEGIDEISKQEKLLTEALSLASQKEQKEIILRLITIYNKLDNQSVFKAYSKGINYIKKLENHFYFLRKKSGK